MKAWQNMQWKEGMMARMDEWEGGRGVQTIRSLLNNSHGL